MSSDKSGQMTSNETETKGEAIDPQPQTQSQPTKPSSETSHEHKSPMTTSPTPANDDVQPQKSEAANTETKNGDDSAKAEPFNNVRTHLPNNTTMVMPGDEKEAAMRQTLGKARDLLQGRDIGDEAHQASLAKEFAEIIDYLTRILGAQKVGRDITTRALVYMKSQPHIPTRIALGRARGDKKRQIEGQIQPHQNSVEPAEAQDAPKVTVDGKQAGTKDKTATYVPEKVEVDIKVSEPEDKDKSFTETNGQKEVENVATAKVGDVVKDTTASSALAEKDPNANIKAQDTDPKTVNGTGKNGNKRRKWYTRKARKASAAGDNVKETAHIEDAKAPYTEEATAMMQ